MPINFLCSQAIGNNPNYEIVGIIVREEDAAEEIWFVCTVLRLCCVSNHKIQPEFTQFLASLQAQAESF